MKPGAGQVDVAVRIGGEIHPDAVARKIGTNRRILAASPSYLAQAGSPKTPSELSDHALIIGPAGRTGEGWTFWCEGQRLTLQVDGRYFFDVTEAATAAAVDGLGIVSTGDLACSEEFRQGSLVRVLPKWDMGSADVHLVFPAGRLAKQSARAFADFMASEYGQLGAS